MEVGGRWFDPARNNLPHGSLRGRDARERFRSGEMTGPSTYPLPRPRLKAEIAQKSRGLSFEVKPKKRTSMIFTVSEGRVIPIWLPDAAHQAWGHGHDLRAASSVHPRGANHSTFIAMPNRSEYQPISQSVDDEEADVAEPVSSPSASRPRRSSVPKKIDLGKLDNAFKRYGSGIAFRGRF